MAHNRIIRNKKNKIVLSVMSALLGGSIITFAMCLRINHIVWISFLNPRLIIRSTETEIKYYADPYVDINASSYELLWKTRMFIEDIQWKKSFTIGNITITSSFGHDGFDYGGLTLRGPGLGISVKRQSGTPSLSYYDWSIVDARDICGGIPKGVICQYDYSFRKTGKLYPFLIILGVAIILEILIMIVVLISPKMKCVKAQM